MMTTANATSKNYAIVGEVVNLLAKNNCTVDEADSILSEAINRIVYDTTVQPHNYVVEDGELIISPSPRD